MTVFYISGKRNIVFPTNNIHFFAVDSKELGPYLDKITAVFL